MPLDSPVLVFVVVFCDSVLLIYWERSVAGEIEQRVELSMGGAPASLAAVLLLLCGALGVPSKNWLLDYYANPALAGAAAVRARIRNASLVLNEVPRLAIRLVADETAILYVDGQRLLDSSAIGTTELSAQQRPPSFDGRCDAT